MSFRTDLMQAARDGVLLAVKWTIALGLIVLVSYGVITDYLAVRARALRGEAAAAYIEKVLAEQQKAQGPVPVPEAK